MQWIRNLDIKYKCREEFFINYDKIMAIQQITIDQHFVPQCYLKEFTNNDWKVFAYNKIWELLKNKYLPKSILFKKLLYELNLQDPDNKIEKFFAKIEDKYSRLSSKLLWLKNLEDFDLNQDEQITLFLFILRLSLGNPSHYDNLNNEEFNDLRKRDVEIHNLPEEDKKKSLGELKEHNRQQLPIAIQVAFQPTFLLEFILRKKFIFIFTKEDKVFLTSDNPIIERCEKWTWLLDWTTVLTDTNYWVALSPYIYLKIIDKDTDPKVTNLAICHDKNWKIWKRHNELMFEQCKSFVYWNIPDFSY